MNMGPRWLGADLTRDFFQTGAELVVGSRWLGAEVTRERDGSGAEVSEFQMMKVRRCWCFTNCSIDIQLD